MGRSKDRADRIREKIDIVRVLYDYGYDIHPDADDREQQFSCDLHGDGFDNTPSARVYPETDSWYCFACGRSRDAIQTVREKKGMSFWEACGLLEKNYGLPSLPWSDSDEQREQVVTPQDEIREALKPHRTFEDELKRVRRQLDLATVDRDLSMSAVLGLWEVFDKINWAVRENVWEEGKGKVALAKLRSRVLFKRKEMPA